jgi:hypothetical protein
VFVSREKLTGCNLKCLTHVRTQRRMVPSGGSISSRRIQRPGFAIALTLLIVEIKVPGSLEGP